MEFSSESLGFKVQRCLESKSSLKRNWRIEQIDLLDVQQDLNRTQRISQRNGNYHHKIHTRENENIHNRSI